MKKYFYRPFSIAVLLLLMMVSFSACLKDTERSEIPAAGIAFIHASPKTSLLDFVNYNSYNNYLLATLPYNTSAVYPKTDTSTTPYRAFLPGLRTIGITHAGTNYFLNIKQFNFAPNKLYSVFAVDTADKTMLVQVEDSLKSIDESRAVIRFINFSPDSKKLELIVGAATTPLSGAKAFKEYSGYYAVEPGDNYTLTVREADNHAKFAKREKVALKKGGIYNIWARGLETATDSTQLNVSVMRTK